jgi:hypothetical protein
VEVLDPDKTGAVKREQLVAMFVVGIGGHGMASGAVWSRSLS